VTGESDAASAWQSMRSLVLDLYDRRQAVSEAVGMSFVRAKALRRLASGPLPMRDLAAALSIDAPYTTLVVDDLEQRGLVERQANPADRRSKLVRITTSGRAVSRKAEKILSTPPDSLGALDREDLQNLERILARLVAGSGASTDGHVRSGTSQPGIEQR
jgi:DNA-binding MarR family transcriptional regulator